MSTKVRMDVEEYLRTSFDGSDCKCLDGEIVERHMGEAPHVDLQTTAIEIPLSRAFDLNA